MKIKYKDDKSVNVEFGTIIQRITNELSQKVQLLVNLLMIKEDINWLIIMKLIF